MKSVNKGHPKDQTKVAVMSRWPSHTGSLTHKMVLWDLEIVVFISSGLLYTDGHYNRFYCMFIQQHVMVHMYLIFLGYQQLMWCNWIFDHDTCIYIWIVYNGISCHHYLIYLYICKRLEYILWTKIVSPPNCK